MEQHPGGGYPLTFSVDYPERPLNRLSTLFRLSAALPILFLATLLTGTGDRAWIGQHPSVWRRAGSRSSSSRWR